MSKAVPAPRIAVVDHGTGNLTSLVRGLELAGAVVERTSSGTAIAGADVVVLPGVGAYPAAMEALTRLGLVGVLREVASAGTPLVGICLGMQLLFEGSDEMGGSEGLSILRGGVTRLDATGERLPHIGWTEVDWRTDHPCRDGLPDPVPMYHVHSFVCRPQDQSDVLANATHGETFTTAVASGSVLGFQFHPEKSSTDGLRLIANVTRLVAGSPSS